jgi:hypothetical protein
MVTIADPAPTTGVLALAADSFVGSFSVQTHLGYSGGVYDTKWASVIRPRLLELGIRHVRERMGTNATVVARFQDLAANGVKLTAGLLGRRMGTIATPRSVSPRPTRSGPR